jgi:type VI secretion system protein ImpF
MAERAHNPTLFDKLIAAAPVAHLAGESGRSVVDADAAPAFYTVTQLERFNEAALRNTVRRELTWLLNTTHLEATQDLTRYPHVKTSVLNYGMPDLTGRVSTPKAIRERTEQIRRGILAFEPRMDPKRLTVEARIENDREAR